MSNQATARAVFEWSLPPLVCGLLAMSLGGAALAQLPANEPMPSLAPMIEQVSPAVVNISVSGRVAVESPLAEDPFFRRFFPPESIESAGSGVIVDAENGYILTNHHVVANAQSITITLLDARSMEAHIVGTDEASDLAVLQVETDNLVEMRLADSDRLRVGDYVVAIGNPFGFSHTVTSGIVSGLGRSGVNPNSGSYENFIQTDASINPGNSGGALVNLRGELVGINSAILSRTGGNIGIGFAIPANMARNVMEQLVTHGKVSRGLLGVFIQSVTPDIAEAYGLPNTAGALVTQVGPDSAAEKAGLKINDVIVSIDGETVADSGALRNAIGLRRPGESVRVGFLRNGREQTVTAVLGRLPPEPSLSRRVPERLEEIDPVFAGARLVPNPTEGNQGLLVASVETNSPAEQRGLREGDIITFINREPVRTMADARALVDDARSIILQVRRDNRSLLLLMR